jgi:uncharacterized protein
LRSTDIAAAALVLIGGLNWGLVALAEFDLVAALTGNDFGETSWLSRIVYGAVGAAALYCITRLATARSAQPARAS